MTASWRETFDLGNRVVPEGGGEEAEGGEEEPQGVFRRLRESLSRSRQALAEEISASLFDRIDEETWERLEELLILADVGAPTTAEIVERLERGGEGGAVPADGAAVQERAGGVGAPAAAGGGRRGPPPPPPPAGVVGGGH